MTLPTKLSAQSIAKRVKGILTSFLFQKSAKEIENSSAVYERNVLCVQWISTLSTLF